MLVDFRDHLYKFYMENEFDVPMTADALSFGAQLMERSFEIQVIARAALKAAVDAGIDPTIFSPVNLEDYHVGGMLLFTASTDEWEYKIAASISDAEYEEFEEGCYRYVGKCAPHPVMDVMRKAKNENHWQVYHKGKWRDDGPSEGYVELFCGKNIGRQPKG